MAVFGFESLILTCEITEFSSEITDINFDKVIIITQIVLFIKSRNQLKNCGNYFWNCDVSPPENLVLNCKSAKLLQKV